MDRIWWKQITKASVFTSKVIEALVAGDSVILSLPRHVPWYATLTDIITEGIIEHGIPRSVDYVDGTNDPGKYLLDNYCKKETRLQYRVGKSYAAFLAEQESITLNSTIVWVENLDAKSLGAWVSFIHEYNRRLLYYLTYSGAIQMRDNNEYGHIRVFKDARNDLAHTNSLSFETVCEILIGKRAAVTVCDN